MNQKSGRQIYLGILADYWFDEDGILHGISKEGPRTLETLEQNFSFVKQITANKKVCLITDTFSAKACDMEMLKYSMNEFKNVYKAIALVPNCPMGKMFGTIFTLLNPADSIPVKMFPNKIIAKDWIGQYKNQTF